jgi:two-component system, NarL family, nitrate/nitrite response regulator NarL
MEIISYIGRGAPNKDIAAFCGIAPDTVKHHLSSIFTKVGVSSRLELALFAVRHKMGEGA